MYLFLSEFLAHSMLHPLDSFKPLGTVEAGIVAFPERESFTPNDEEPDWGNAYHYDHNRQQRALAAPGSKPINLGLLV